MKKRSPVTGKDPKAEKDYKYPIPLEGVRRERIDTAVARMDSSMKNVMLLAMDIGLLVLERANYDVAQAMAGGFAPAPTALAPVPNTVAFPHVPQRLTGVISLPMIGTIAAGDGDTTDNQGQATISEDFEERADFHIDVPAELKRLGAAFVLRVKGDSMNAAHPEPIYNGQKVVMALGRSPVDGDIIACLIDGKTTLKRLMIEQGTGRPVLVSESTNPVHRNIMPMDGMMWQGIMIGRVP